MPKSETELSDRLDEIQDMLDENRIWLKKIHRKLVIGQVMKVFYWLIIIGLGILGYYAAMPYLSQLETAYEDIQSGIGTVEQIFNIR